LFCIKGDTKKNSEKHTLEFEKFKKQSEQKIFFYFDTKAANKQPMDKHIAMVPFSSQPTYPRIKTRKNLFPVELLTCNISWEILNAFDDQTISERCASTFCWNSECGARVEN